MDNNSSNNYENSEYLREEATTQKGVFIDEIWDAIVARENIIDRLAESGVITVDEIKISGYFDASKRVRTLQDMYGVERYPELDE